MVEEPLLSYHEAVVVQNLWKVKHQDFKTTLKLTFTADLSVIVIGLLILILDALWVRIWLQMKITKKILKKKK